MTGSEALRRAIPRLKDAGVEDAVRDARLLLSHALELDFARLTLHLADEVPSGAAAHFEEFVAARVRRQPVSQITGQRLFWGRLFRVTPDVLDPRPETEVLVAAAVERPFANVLDLGTGSGCILLSCLAEMPNARGVGGDISAAAIAVAQDNAERLGLSSRARFQQADWCRGVEGSFDLIVSNPPYVAANEMSGLSPEVRDWEPHLALTPGGDGLDGYRRIASQAPCRLMIGGRLIVEIGPSQAAAVAAMFASQGLESIQIRKDFDGRDRVVMAVKAV